MLGPDLQAAQSLRALAKRLHPQFRSKRPNRSCGEQIPFVFCLKKVAKFFSEIRTTSKMCTITCARQPAHADIDDAVLNIVRESFFERLRGHRYFVLLIWRLSEAFERRSLDDRLTKADDWISDLKRALRERRVAPTRCYLDVDLAEHFAHVVHNRVEVELAGAEHYVLAGLLDARRQQRIRFVHFAQRVEHLGQLGWVDRLDRQLHHRARVEFERPKDVNLQATAARHLSIVGTWRPPRRLCSPFR